MVAASEYRNLPGCFAAVFLIAATLVLPPTAARASIFDTFDDAIDTIQAGFEYVWPDDIEVEDFSIRLGAGFGITPDYVGSDDYRYRFVPLIDIRYKDKWALQGTKFHYHLFSRDGLKAGPLLNYRFGRESERNRALDGLEDIKDTIDLGAFVEYRKASFVVSGDVRKALGAGQGLTAQVTAAQGIYHTDKFALGAGLRARWRSGRNTQTNFGITPDQSAESGHRIFDAGGGFSSFGLSVLGRYRLGEKWRLEGLLAFSRLVGDAADSPLVEDVGSASQALGGIGIRYIF